MADPDDALYALPLEEFTSTRDKTAREIRKAGDKEAAARIAKLPKPSPAAWTANQVAREQPELVEALLDAGAGLRAAQDAAMSGGGAAGLREATLAERQAIDAVMKAATDLKPAGKPLSRAMADRLRTTLHAAAGDPQLRAALAAGRLVSEAQAGGAWPFAIGAPAEDTPAPPPKRKPKPSAKESDAEREERERAEREAAELRQALEAELHEARDTLRSRERISTGAQEDAEATARAVDEARERLAETQAALTEAEAEAQSAERVLKEADAARAEARDTVARLEERLD